MTQTSEVPVLRTPITNALVSQLLERNHKEHHIFFGRELHNHFPHVLLSEFALGADDVSFLFETLLVLIISLSI